MHLLTKTALLSAFLVTAAAPAMAQDFGHAQHAPQAGIVREGYDLFQQIDRLQGRIDRGRGDGDLSRGEARKVQAEVSGIRSDLERATRGRHRLSPAEHGRFEKRLDRAGDMIRRASDHGHRPGFRG